MVLLPALRVPCARRTTGQRTARLFARRASAARTVAPADNVRRTTILVRECLPREAASVSFAGAVGSPLGGAFCSPPPLVPPPPGDATTIVAGALVAAALPAGFAPVSRHARALPASPAAGVYERPVA